MPSARILVAEDDANIRLGLKDALESEGYEVVVAADGVEAIMKQGQGGFALLILDIMMPGKSGYDVCREIRKKDSKTPIIMLTAKSEEIDKVVGLQLGADDYVTKPFGLKELLARVAAALRRSTTDEPVAEHPAVFDFADARIDRRKYQSRVGRQVHELSARELKLIEVFAAHAGEVLNRNELLNKVWGVDYSGTTRTLDQHIAQLRKKVEQKPAAPRHLITVHTVGYRYQP